MPRVLVIDDDSGTRETFGVILRLAGFDVATAATGHDGLAILRRCACDLVLADLRLPDMTGVDVLRIVRDQRLDIPFVIMTAFGSIASAIDAIKLGAGDYLEKPLTNTDLLNVVRRSSLEITSHPVQTAESDSTPSVGAAVGRQVGALDPRVIEALRIIETGYSNASMRLRTVARQLDISVEYLCRLLKRDTGRGFGFHLHQARIREAKRLLQQTNLSVKEIAYRTGYVTTTRLDRHFKNACGFVPGQLRRSTE